MKIKFNMLKFFIILVLIILGWYIYSTNQEKQVASFVSQKAQNVAHVVAKDIASHEKK